MRNRNKALIRGGIMMLIFLIGFTLHGQTNMVRINEFMALNSSTLQDEDGDFSDWIELYNAGAESVDLSGWSLTDDPTDLLKWTLPTGVVIDAHGFLLIYASGKDRSLQGGELHASFRLSGVGEYLALVDQEGLIVTEFNPTFPLQQTDISFGYYDGTYIQLTTPTPGTDNQKGEVLLQSPEFTVAHGIIENPITLELISQFPGAEIFYTLDGSTPHIETAQQYTSPLYIDRTSIVRAVSVIHDTNYSSVMTQSYIFPDDVIHQSNSPEGYPAEWGPYSAIAGTAIADYEMDPEMMSDPVFAASVIEGLKSLPVISLVSDISHFFSHSTDPDTGGIYIYTGSPVGDGLGKGWERPASIEYMTSDGSESFQVNCGVRLQGGHSRLPEKSPKHSFRLVFRYEYGPTKLDYPLFKDEDATTSFNSIVLRAGFGLSWIHHSHSERLQAQYQRDVWIKDTQRAIGHPSSHSTYVHLFINGIYWGIYAPSERIDSDFAASYLKGEPEDFDVIKDYQEVANGTIEAWNNLIAQVNAGVSDNAAYQRIQGNNPDGTYNPVFESMVDVVNLADYMLLNFYGGNTDWDQHNWAAIRNREDPFSGFKFFCWDAEHILKSVSQNVLNENNDRCPSRVFQQLRTNEQFLRLFSDRVQRHCFNDGALTPQSAFQRWNNRTAQVETGIPAESARWGDYRRDVHPYQTSGPFELYTYSDHWVTQRNFIVSTYFPERTQVLLNQLRSAGLFPTIDAPRFFINGVPYPVENISLGDELSMSSSEGIIYYTTNGKDPAKWEIQDESTETVLIAREDKKYVTVPKSDIGNLWRSDVAYNHGSWLVCSGAPGGIGYENGSGYEDLITLDVSSDMSQGGNDPNSSCYVRIPFTIEAGELDNMKALFLNLWYDDGFAVFLNGTRVAEYNAPGELFWNSASSGTHEAVSPETFDISSHISLLTEGENLLAIQALNSNTSSSDFLIMLELKAGDQISSSVANEALMYSEALNLTESCHIKARTYLNGSWSAMMSSFITFPEDYEDIKVTEIHYHPLGEEAIDNKEFEFIELKNTGSSTLDLGGLVFQEGLNFTFASETELSPHGFVVLAADRERFYSRYGFLPDGEYAGNLNNGGERLLLKSPSGDTIFMLFYDNETPWPIQADGAGYSLVPTEINPAGNQNGPQNWRYSYHIGGSPGRDDTPSTQTEIHIPEKSLSALGQNYPNPFTDITYINYVLPKNAWIDISVFNLMGQKVAVLVSGDQIAGSHVVSWNGTHESGDYLKEGIYIYRMIIRSQDENRIFTRKMIRY